jgi:hypothetical protein
MKELFRARVAPIAISFDLIARINSFLRSAVIENDDTVDLKDGTGSRQLGGRHRL